MVVLIKWGGEYISVLHVDEIAYDVDHVDANHYLSSPEFRVVCRPHFDVVLWFG